jgi:hypothetical protein
MRSISVTEEHQSVVENLLEAASEFKRVFQAPFSEGLLAEAYVALHLDLRLCAGNNAGFDAIDDDGTRYQIKLRSAGTLNVDLNNFDFDKLVLVNLSDDLRVSGMWIASREDVERHASSRDKFRKCQLTQTKLKSISKRLV